MFVWTECYPFEAADYGERDCLDVIAIEVQGSLLEEYLDAYGLTIKPPVTSSNHGIDDKALSGGLAHDDMLDELVQKSCVHGSIILRPMRGAEGAGGDLV